MIRYAFIVMLCMLACSGFAQNGLFDLNFGEAVAISISTMNANGFRNTGFSHSVLDFAPTKESPSHEFVDAVMLVFDPDTEVLVGWFIKYNGNNSSDIDKVILDALVSMHGDEQQYDEDTDQLIWHLGGTRTVYAMYTPDDCLVILYFDREHQHLFNFEE